MNEAPKPGETGSARWDELGFCVHLEAQCIDCAWTAVEKALPKGVWLEEVTRYNWRDPEAAYQAQAFTTVTSEGDSHFTYAVGHGPTPAAALQSLLKSVEGRQP
jgi:hypothetical protein